MTLVRFVAVLLMSAMSAFAQPGRGGVALGHVHLNSAHPDAAMAFWTETIGASAFNRGDMAGVSMIGGLILIAKSESGGPGAGGAIDHIALHVPDLQPFIDRLGKTPYKSAPGAASGQLMIEGPDGVKVELIEDSSMYAPLDFAHIQFDAPQPDEMQAWYAKVFGARPDTEEKNTSRVGGGVLVFEKAAALGPSSGRAIDHVAFEVRDLEAFCKKLESDGIKLDSPYRAMPELKMASAFLTDPWGVRIELTEGLTH
jgi:catechol 2,3-dioxygenase-like lactoylglutathione lyase family enzyme